MKRMTIYYGNWRQLNYPMDNKQKLLKCMMNSRRYRKRHNQDVTVINVIIKQLRRELGNEKT